MSKAQFNGLNKQQKEAILNWKGPSIILAGAGSGKTRVLVHKVLDLIENHRVTPESIVMITFTNKAAGEMKERIFKKLPKSHSIGYVGTFHSFCAMILRRDGMKIGLAPGFTIYDDSDQNALVKSILKKLGITKFTSSYFASRISYAKNQLIDADSYSKIFSDFSAKDVGIVYKNYQKQLEKNQAVDFDDLLNKVILLFTKYKSTLQKYQDKYKFFLVDEFQDTNLAQYQLTKLLASKSKNITVVGDFSQSIYSWRGADITNLEKLKKDFPKSQVYNLEINYRSTQSILDFAYDIISKNETHPILKLTTDNRAGEEVFFFEAGNEQDEAIFVCEQIQRLNNTFEYASFCVLYRTNAQSRVLEEAFLHFGIPYVLIGGTRFYERREIKDILSYLRLLNNKKDQVSLERIKKIGKQRYAKFEEMLKEAPELLEKESTDHLIEKIFETTSYLKLYNPDDPEDYARIENIKELKSVALKFPNLTDFLEQVALVESEYFENEKKNKARDGVRLMTLHQAKGLEFDCVFICGVEEGLIPHSRSTDDKFQIEEERRLFYVGITRARHKLHITYTRKRFIFGRRNYSMKSRFLMNEEDVHFY